MKFLKRGLLLLVLLASVLTLLIACSESDDDDNPAGPAPEAPYDVKQVQGQVVLPAGVNDALDDLEVVSFADDADVGNDGGFAINIVEGQNGPMLFFLNNLANAFPVMIGLLEDENGQVEFSVETTVVALMLLNPNLFGTSVEEREAYVAAVRAHPDFQAMVDGFAAIYAEDGANALDFDQNPEVYQNLAEFMKDVMETMAFGQTVQGVDEFVAPPYIESGMGGVVHVMNPTFAHYGLNVEGISANYSLTQHAARRTEAIMYWGWPPMMVEGDMDTPVTLADGSYYVHLNKGPDFTNIANMNDPAGLATLYNSSNIVLSIVDLIVGQLPLYPEPDDLIGNLNVSVPQGGDITRGISQGDETDVLVSYLDIINSNSSSLAGWMWNGAQAMAAEIYLEVATNLMKDISFTFELLSYQHATGPFVYDFVHAVDQVTYIVTVENGVVTQVDEDYAPEAMFFVNPPAGVVETVFVFDATGSTDDLSAYDDLLFRWDFNGDGVFDTGWSHDNEVVSHSYSETGAWDVVLEVMDTSELVGLAGGVVNVGGGAGTATHVKLFRDGLPWSSDAMDEMLISLGFTEGTGDYQYEIFSSDQMGTVPLIPGTDLVIISNDQATYFYQNYAANMARFNNFVYMGGSLFWEACDQGWAYGDMLAAGVVLPGNVGFEHNNDYYNYVVDPLLPLVAGLPTTLDHNYASHESFVDLVLGTTVYCEDSYERPTLIEYSLGGGWVLMSGQPLEHQYDHNYGTYDDMNQLLPRIVSYFLGVEMPAVAQHGSPSDKLNVRDTAGNAVQVD